MAQKQFKIGLSNADKQNMAQDVYERLLALTFPEYDASTQYSVGDFVVYNDQLYKCISATSGAWDSSKWQLATLNDLVADIEGAVAFVNDKANVDGNYPTMTVGVADNLSPYDEEAGIKQSEPFNFQASGTNNGSNPLATVGELALLKEKRGNTVVVNQHIPVISSGLSVQGVEGSVTYNNNKVTLTCSGSQTNILQMYKTIGNQDLPIIAGHKYLQCAAIYSSKNLNITLRVYNNLTGRLFSLTAGVAKFCIYVGEATENTSYKEVGFVSSENNVLESGDVVWFENMSLIDLTQWFNGDIPQDLLDNPSNFFRYYQGSLAYNKGELVNANGRYLKAIGRNQFDGTNDVKVVPNSTYYIYGSATLTYKDKDGNTISSESKSNETFDVPANCLSIGVSGSGNICISLYYEGESGYDQYYPYEELTNNDTGTETLRSAGSVKDYKTPDGTITRNIKSSQLGALIDSVELNTYYTELLGVNVYSFSKFSDAKDYGGYTTKLIADKIVCETFKGSSYTGQYIFGEASEYSYMAVLPDMDLTAAKTFLASLTFNYELATPITEQGTPFFENVEIDDFGSMSFEGTNGVPQGALIFYPVDYKAYLDTLYKYTDGDPDNLALKSDLAVVNEKIGVKIPECPTTIDGTYVLKATVSNGSVVYSWVLEE